MCVCSGDDRADPADHAAGAHQAQAGGAEGELQATSGRASQTGRYGTGLSRSGTPHNWRLQNKSNFKGASLNFEFKIFRFFVQEKNVHYKRI